MEITTLPPTSENTRQMMTCPKCSHIWFCRIIPAKVYYMCPRCHYQFKINLTE